MSGYFTLTLDTTAPTVSILAPSYTTPQTSDEITVLGNETLSTTQDIYIIDSNGVRRDYTFDYQTDRFVGLVSWDGYPYGPATIYAQIKDEVDNTSALASKSINIRSGSTLEFLRLDISDRCATVDVNHRCAKLDISAM